MVFSCSLLRLAEGSNCPCKVNTHAVRSIIFWSVYTPPKFNSSPLKNDGKGRPAFPFGFRLIFRGELLNFAPGCIYIYILKKLGAAFDVHMESYYLRVSSTELRYLCRLLDGALSGKVAWFMSNRTLRGFVVICGWMVDGGFVECAECLF